MKIIFLINHAGWRDGEGERKGGLKIEDEGEQWKRRQQNGKTRLIGICREPYPKLKWKVLTPAK